MDDSIVGSLAAKQPERGGSSTVQWLILTGAVAGLAGLVMRLVARSQLGSTLADPMFGASADRLVRDTTTLGNVGLGLLIAGGALVFLGLLAVVVRRR